MVSMLTLLRLQRRTFFPVFFLVSSSSVVGCSIIDGWCSSLSYWYRQMRDKRPSFSLLHVYTYVYFSILVKIVIYMYRLVAVIVVKVV